MEMTSRKQYLKSIQIRYKKGTRKEKTKILDEFCENTKHNRKYVIQRLNNPSLLENIEKSKKKRSCKYGKNVKLALITLWEIFSYSCGQRLKVQISENLDKLIELKEICVSHDTYYKLLEISYPTIDRKLKDKKTYRFRQNISGTKKGTLLKNQIPIKITDYRTATKIGFLEIDLVCHNGGNPSGTFINTLSMTDITSDWWCGVAIMGKGQHHTLKALTNTIEVLPFNIWAIDSDNGGEFINYHLLEHCKHNNIEFTRGRANHSNDNSYVEQKNGAVIRSFVGYYRHDTDEELLLLNDLYHDLMLYHNFFQPTIKTLKKERVNGKLKRIREKVAITPFKRVLNSNDVLEKNKQKLTDLYKALNPAELKRSINKKTQLLHAVSIKTHSRKTTNNKRKEVS